MNINELLKCLNCGFCVKGCPEYIKYQKETKSPRGKIRNIKYSFENKNNIDLSEFDECKGCDKCKDICPANIDFITYFNKVNLEVLLNENRN